MQKRETYGEEEVAPRAVPAGVGTGWRDMAATLPAIGVALLPKLACPACWPAYAGVLSAMGIGFANLNPYLLPLTALFLFLAIASLGFRARSRRGYGPFALGTVAAIIVVVGKFILMHDATMYGGIILLMGASLWNSWPRHRKGNNSCPACVS